MRGSWIFQGITPSSPPIKGGSPSSFQQHTKEKSYTTREIRASLQGLRP